MSLFYVPNLAIACILPEEESQHAVKVLRLKSGDPIEIVDGVGGYYKAKITLAHPKHCGFEITESHTGFGKRNYKLHLAIAPTKNIERLEWFIEKATEIGIDEISPLVCRFSERKIIKPERLEKIIVSAGKQSLKAFFPTLNPLQNFEEFMQHVPVGQKFIAHCYQEEKQLLQTVLQQNSDVLILIGPEGDFSPEEIKKALSLGFVPVSLGDSRLRTETAGVMACASVAIKNQ